MGAENFRGRFTRKSIWFAVFMLLFFLGLFFYANLRNGFWDFRLDSLWALFVCLIVILTIIFMKPGFEKVSPEKLAWLEMWSDFLSKIKVKAFVVLGVLVLLYILFRFVIGTEMSEKSVLFLQALLGLVVLSFIVYGACRITKAKKPNAVFGVLSMIFGILGFALCVVPLLGLLLSILAIVFYVKQKRIESTGTAVLGLVLGIFGILLGILFTILVPLLITQAG